MRRSKKRAADQKGGGVIAEEASGEEGGPEGGPAYPDNLSLGNLLQFLPMPTLVYQPAYPRSTRFRGRWLLWCARARPRMSVCSSGSIRLPLCRGWLPMMSSSLLCRAAATGWVALATPGFATDIRKLRACQTWGMETFLQPGCERVNALASDQFVVVWQAACMLLIRVALKHHRNIIKY